MDAHPLRHIPEARNRRLAAAVIALQAAVVLLSPMAWRAGWPAFIPLLMVHAYGTVLGWLLIHEAIHLKLRARRAGNDALGRLLSVLFGAPFHLLKVGHMTHHRHNRGALDTTELMPHGTRRAWAWTLAYYARICGLLYVSEVLAPLAFVAWRWTKRLVLRAARVPGLDAVLELFTRPVVNAIRIDAAASFALIALIVVWHRDAPGALLALLAVRAFAVSYYDNAYHYGTDPEDTAAALNLSVPRWLGPFILNHNYHRVHHRYPVASWAALPGLFARDGDRFDRPLAAAAFDQMKGPLRRPRGSSAP